MGRKELILTTLLREDAKKHRLPEKKADELLKVLQELFALKQLSSSPEAE